MRMISEEMRSFPKPLRLSYFGQCFRYEESKKGRYREFFQYGVELIGASGPLAEAEVVSLSINMLEACGLADYEVRIDTWEHTKRYLEWPWLVFRRRA